MKKKLIKYLFLTILLTGLFFVVTVAFQSEVNAQSCDGPTYCNGPCDVLVYPPNNCSCDQQVCTVETYCPGDSNYEVRCCSWVVDPYEGGSWDCSGVGCCTANLQCTQDILTFSCGGPCINICDGGGGGGGGGGGSDACTVDLVPDNNTIANGSFTTLTANVNVVSGTVEGVAFISGDAGIVTVDPNTDTTSPYETEATGQTVNSSTTVRADVQMSGNIVCQDTANVSVVQPFSWWQAIDADIISLGNLISQIPAVCSGGCNPIFDLDGPGGFPGLPIYTGSYDFSDASGQGTVSSTGWLAEATYNDTREYKYAYFDRKIPSDATINEIETPSITGGEIDSGGTEYNGYYWYHFDGDTYGDLIINSDVTIAGDRKVILFVESANLYLQGDVTIQADGQGFLLAIAGETTTGAKGNIDIAGTVGGTNDGFPEIEGLFVADNEFTTGSTGVDSDSQLHIRGSVAAHGGISLQRDLADDTQTPAEVIEYAPELMLLFPKSLSLERMRWEEVAP